MMTSVRRCSGMTRPVRFRQRTRACPSALLIRGRSRTGRNRRPGRCRARSRRHLPPTRVLSSTCGRRFRPQLRCGATTRRRPASRRCLPPRPARCRSWRTPSTNPYPCRGASPDESRLAPTRQKIALAGRCRKAGAVHRTMSLAGLEVVAAARRCPHAQGRPLPWPPPQPRRRAVATCRPQSQSGSSSQRRSSVRS